MSDPVRIVCPVCDAANNVPAARLGDGPKCGKCKSPLFVGEPLALNDLRLGRHVSGSGIPVVVDFWASWCGPCRSFAPVFQAAAGTVEPRARFVKVDVDAAQQAAARYNITSIPTLMLFKDGKVVDRVAGALPASQFTAWLARNL
jgi:thioredoxin 2